MAMMPTTTMKEFRRLLPREQRRCARREGHYLGCSIYADSESHFYRLSDFFVAFTLTHTRQVVHSAFRGGAEFDRMLRGIRLSLAPFDLVASPV